MESGGLTRGLHCPLRITTQLVGGFIRQVSLVSKDAGPADPALVKDRIALENGLEPGGGVEPALLQSTQQSSSDESDLPRLDGGHVNRQGDLHQTVNRGGLIPFSRLQTKLAYPLIGTVGLRWLAGVFKGADELDQEVVFNAVLDSQ